MLNQVNVQLKIKILHIDDFIYCVRLVAKYTANSILSDFIF